MFGLCVRFTCRDAGRAAAFDQLVAETVPAISWPGTIGNSLPPHSSRAWWMSEWQTPA